MSFRPFLHLDKGLFGRPTSPVRADLANVAGDYTYLTRGYYASLDAQMEGALAIPSTTDALDAYVVAIAMEKAKQAGIPVPEYEIVTDRFPEPPMMAYPINPFSLSGELLLDAQALESRRKGLTYTGKYAVLAQRLPHDHRVDVVRLVLGRTVTAEYREFGERLFEVFRLPLMRVRVIVTLKAYQLSAIEPLPFKDLDEGERAVLESLGTWRA
ncbi:MAG: RimK-like ATPgrasp N-terminal domain-containing protein [Trueperaceae bacterium]|nr:RimK-like ATPgrasp N-terminal domain-containing protein [Trueperaceae bacterium]MCC6311485.1 RimK-like ATPgrasp N-terminal domain-containing protein [Trueperaceae bacterium]MCO5172986.1 RimK-like ATPgrasp N-terminal domain-containing protein [Trueperaceae bacterium]MCW5819713.1 RimK-like ATPgrasp N-terminal domain-containing protein [Trueperaceae bacterium]